MARAYDDDLRRKLLLAYDRGDDGLLTIAQRFAVSYGWAQKVVRQRRLTGQAERVRHKPGPRGRMTDEVASYLREQVTRNPDLTLTQLRQALLADQGVQFSVGRLWKLLRVLYLPLKRTRVAAVPKTSRKLPGSLGTVTTTASTEHGAHM
ncbi:MAG: hypothetical protein FWD64_03175 [Acidobacteriaceae bacterium]|nr:hypothetical protein [Acidobacteriaceae bacterium]